MADEEKNLISAVRSNDQEAWKRLIAQYQGRLMAFAESRLNNRASAEDVIQETFIGFITSLPNYDEQTPLESFLFAIAAHKLTDALRRSGRRPILSLTINSDTTGSAEPIGPDRKASSLARSAEHGATEERVIAECMRGLIQSWLSRGEFERLQCVELLFVIGLPNKDVAIRLGISEQAVANHKSFVVQKLKDTARAAKLSNVDWRRFE